MHWPLTLALSLLIIIIGVNRKLHLGLTMLLSGTALIVAGGMPPRELPEAAYATLADRSTQTLLLSVIALEILGNLLKKTGGLQQMVVSLGRLIGDLRLLTVTLPALIGILTVPGGAIFSAPLVEQAGGEAGLSPARQAAANLWFRHVFYFAYPLFPSAVLAAQLAGVSVLTFLYFNLSITAAGLLAAFPLIFRGIRRRPGRIMDADGAGEPQRSLSRDLAGLGLSLAPLITILLLVIVVDLFFPLALAAGIMVALINGIGIGRGFAAAVLRRVREIILPGLSLNLVLVVLGIMFYKQTLQHSGLTGLLAAEMLAWGWPLLLLMFIFPVLTGLLTGDNNASIAIVFPLLLPLLDAAAPVFAAQVALIYFSSAWGHIFTPIHPCFSLTSSYFKVGFYQVLRVLLLPAAFTALLALVQFFLLFTR